MPAETSTGARTLLIRPRGGMLVRDGRPFAATPGARAASLAWPLPSTIAGALRTRIGDDLGFDWRNGGPERALRLAVAGPLLAARGAHDLAWTTYLPAPRDALLARAEPEAEPLVYPLHPTRLADGAGCDLPHPALLPLQVPVSAKPDRGSAYWPLDALVAWLADPGTPVPQPLGCLGAMPRETRVHVAIDRERETAREGALFATERLVFADGHGIAGLDQARAMLCRVAGEAGWAPPTISYLTVGGERGLSEVHTGGDAAWPVLPDALLGSLEQSTRLRLVLATPAIFAGGWRPGWLDDSLEGSPPGLSGARLRLVAAAVGRREPVSGWDLVHRRPKAARFMAPAGSVYFFECLGGPLDAATIRHLWLGSICDAEQDRRDGFGLALPGNWHYAEGE